MQNQLQTSELGHDQFLLSFTFFYISSELVMLESSVRAQIKAFEPLDQRKLRKSSFFQSILM